MIPHLAFRALESAMLNVQAGEELQAVQAVAHGYALARAGSDGPSGAEAKRLFALAFPMIPLDKPER